MNVNTSYVISRSLSIYSSPIVVDHMTLYLNSLSCCSIAIANRFLNNSGFPIRIPISGLNNSNTIQPIRIDLEVLNPDQCFGSSSNSETSNDKTIDVSYMIEYESSCDRFLRFSDIEDQPPLFNQLSANGKYMTTRRLIATARRTSSSSASSTTMDFFIEFQLTDIQRYPFYNLDVKLTLIDATEGEYCLHNENK